jgi:hypothetical protein
MAVASVDVRVNCTGTPTPGTASGEDKAIAWARGQIGRYTDDHCRPVWMVRPLVGWCLRQDGRRLRHPYEMYAAFRAMGPTQTAGTPPAGTFIVFDKALVNGNSGHVARAEATKRSSQRWATSEPDCRSRCNP